MKLVIDIDPADQEQAVGPNRTSFEDIEAIIRRRLLSGPRADLQIQGFECTVVGVAMETTTPHLPPGLKLMVVELLEGS